jgi:serine/threonine protein kinase
MGFTRALNPTAALDLTSQEVVGTPPFMALEVLQGRPHSAKSDVWSFGIVLWHILEERSPDLLQQEGITTCGPDTVSRLAELLVMGTRLRFSNPAPTWAAGIYERCTQQDPLARPTFTELFHTLNGAHHEQK